MCVCCETRTHFFNVKRLFFLIFCFMAIWAILGNIVANMLNSTLQDNASQNAVSALSSFVSKSFKKTVQQEKQISKNPDNIPMQSNPSSFTNTF